MPDQPADEHASSAAASGPRGEADFPATGRLLGLDYGSQRIGVAVSNVEQTIASPVDVWVRRTVLRDAAHLRELVSEYEIAGIVVGLPVHLSGAEGGKAREAKSFGHWSASAGSRPVRFFDERFTTADAEQHLLASGMTRQQRKDRLDKVAAQIMLQAYLDSARRGEPPPALHG